MSSVNPRAGTLRISAHMVVADVTKAVEIEINIASNESAYGPGAAAIAAAASAASQLERYAETAQDELGAAIAEHFALNQQSIVCGNGSDDLLARIARAYLSPGDELVYSCNGYQKIPNYAFANDAEPVAASDQEFTVDVDAVLSQVNERTRIVMIANPDNPTGTYISGAEVRRLHAGLPSNVLLVLDSAYLEYVGADDYENPQKLVEEMDNILMTRTFSKIYGLAGARVGWLYAPPEIADVIRKIGTTFPISNTAFLAAMAALEDQQHTEYVFQQNQRIRDEYSQSFAALGLKVYPSQTNFLLVEFSTNAESAMQAYEYLASQGIAARRFASPAFGNCVRFTLGLEIEMQKALTALQKFMQQQESS
jgi:histidinol-phosphate aminotransferase